MDMKITFNTFTLNYIFYTCKTEVILNDKVNIATFNDIENLTYTERLEQIAKHNNQLMLVLLRYTSNEDMIKEINELLGGRQYV